MGDALIAALKERVLRVRVHGFQGAGDWNPDLHPRGHDGKFIEVGWLVNLIDMAGFRHGQRGKKEVQGEVVGIIPDPDDPGNPIIRVKMTDPRWNPSMFGETFDARSYQVAKREPPKGKLDDIAPDIELLPDTPPKPKTSKLPEVAPVASLGVPLPPMPDPPGKVTAEWVSAQMTADLTVFRGKETIWSMPGADPEMALGLAETYRQLTHDDTETALRVDYIITDSQASLTGDPLIKPTGPSAIAVAHPGTAHPGGIGPKTGKTAIVLGDRFVKDKLYWMAQKGSAKGGLPWSMSSETGSINQTITHEFGHQRQFRMLALAMDEVGQSWSDVIQPDGFGTVPDSSNWPEIQEARYDIQAHAPTAYGRSKSSEAYAEVWASSLMGPLSPELQEAWDKWHAGMSMVEKLPQERYGDDDRKQYIDMTDAEKLAYWEKVAPLLDLPGMREHYPETAALYDEWNAPAEMTTLYRGEGSHDRPSYYTGPDKDMAGGWWTTDLEAAQRYAQGQKGQVYEIDVEPSEFEKRGLHQFIPDPRVRLRRRVYGEEPEPAQMVGANRLLGPPDTATKGYQTWKGIRLNNQAELDALLTEAANELGGAWSYGSVFGEFDFVRADNPSKIPTAYYYPSRNRIFYNGQWREFPQTAKNIETGISKKPNPQSWN